MYWDLEVFICSPTDTSDECYVEPVVVPDPEPEPPVVPPEPTIVEPEVEVVEETEPEVVELEPYEIVPVNNVPYLTEYD